MGEILPDGAAPVAAADYKVVCSMGASAPLDVPGTRAESDHGLKALTRFVAGERSRPSRPIADDGLEQEGLHSMTPRGKCRPGVIMSGLLSLEGS